jgi:UDP-3-O-[3-hydroxymyristoyl] glucosamine N-acyltransferase
MPIYGDLSVLGRDQDIRVVVALGDPSRRRAAAEKIESMVGPRFASAIHPVATIGGEVRIDTGVMVLGPASITTGVSIGRHVVINPPSATSIPPAIATPGAKVT